MDLVAVVESEEYSGIVGGTETKGTAAFPAA